MEYSVGDEKSLLVFVSQRINAVSQGQERTINLGPFHQPEASVLGDCPSLGACQVDKRKFSNDAFNFNILCLACLGDTDLENCMTTRRGEVGIGGFGSPPPVADEQQVHDLFGGLGLELSHSRHDYTFFRVISELEVP
jgi:hypothetical protein